MRSFGVIIKLPLCFIDAGKGAYFARTRGLWFFADVLLVVLEEKKNERCVCSLKRKGLAVEIGLAFGSVF